MYRIFILVGMVLLVSACAYKPIYEEEAKQAGVDMHIISNTQSDFIYVESRATMSRPRVPVAAGGGAVGSIVGEVLVHITSKSAREKTTRVQALLEDYSISPTLDDAIEREINAIDWVNVSSYVRDSQEKELDKQVYRKRYKGTDRLIIHTYYLFSKDLENLYLTSVFEFSPKVARSREPKPRHFSISVQSPKRTQEWTKEDIETFLDGAIPKIAEVLGQVIDTPFSMKYYQSGFEPVAVRMPIGNGAMSRSLLKVSMVDGYVVYVDKLDNYFVVPLEEMPRMNGYNYPYY